MNPFIGRWVANIKKSQRHPNHRFQSATATFETSDDVLSLTHAGVNMAGRHESATFVLHPDGQEHAVSAQASDVVMVTKWVGTHVLESEARKDGRAVGN